MTMKPDEIEVGQKDVIVICHMPGLSMDSTIVNVVPEEKLLVVNYSYVRKLHEGGSVGGELTGGFPTVELPVEVGEDFVISYADDALKVVIPRASTA